MNNFLFENKTKVYFGKGGVKEHLSSLLKHYGDTVLLAYGGGSVSDCCKVVSAQAKVDEDLWELENVKHALPSQFIPLGTIVTVFGTGSEMNSGAVTDRWLLQEAEPRRAAGHPQRVQVICLQLEKALFKEY